MLSDEEVMRRLSMNGKRGNYLQLRRGIFEPKHSDVLRGETFRVFVFLCAIANSSREPMSVAEVGRNQIARILGVSVSTAAACIKQLCAGEYVKKNEFGFLIPRLEVDRNLIHPESQPDQKSIRGGSISDPGVDQKSIRTGSKSDPPILLKEEEKKIEEENTRATKQKAKRKSPTAHLIRWDGSKGTFEGERQKLRARIYERYGSLGDRWIQAQWQECVEWCQDNPAKIAAKADHWLFVLGWFRRNATKRRQWK